MLSDFDFLQDAGHEIADILCLTNDVVKTTKEFYDLEGNKEFSNKIDTILCRHISKHEDYDQKKEQIIIATAKLALEKNLYVVKRDEKYKSTLKSTSEALEKAIGKFEFEDLIREFLIEEIRDHLHTQDQQPIETYQEAEKLSEYVEKFLPLLRTSLQKQINLINNTKGRLAICPTQKTRELKDQLASDLKVILESAFAIPATTTDESTGGIFDALFKECCAFAGLKKPGKRPAQTSTKKRLS